MNQSYHEYHNLTGRNMPISFLLFEKYDHFPPCFHWHSELEILLMDTGSGTITIDGTDYTITPGEMYVINTHIIHNFHGDPYMRYYCIIIDDSFLMENGINTSKLTFDTKIISPDANSLFMNIIKELTEETPFQATGVRAAILQFVLRLLRNHSVLRDTSSTYPTDNLQYALSFINSHFAEKLTVDSIAAKIGFSKFHFSRIFKASTGLTLTQYINTVRCNHAKELLKKGELSIHDISIKCGFENDSYFSKTFKKYTGVLPSEYEKIIEGIPQTISPRQLPEKYEENNKKRLHD